MKLKELISVLPGAQIRNNAGADHEMDPEIDGITQDSRSVKLGSAFIAVVGGQSDGHQFLDAAIKAGASALIVQKNQIDKMSGFSSSVPVVEVEDTRGAQSRLARQLYRDPSHRMLCFGVTGTNGKTSITYILEHLLNRAGLPAGVIGTIDHHLNVDGEKTQWPSQHTTPDPILLQRRLKEMKDLGAKSLAMEVSSHGLDQGRVSGVAFNTVIFTNLTRDHLDYHASMEEYFQAKQKLFTDLLWESGKVPLFAVVNRDDPWGVRLRVSSKAGLWTYGTTAQADFRYQMKSQGFDGAEFLLTTPLGELTCKIPLCGIHNVANVVAAIAGVASIGVSPEQSIRFLRDFEGVPGRLQRVPDARDRFVFVDYAHTPDGLENTMKTVFDIRNQAALNEGSKSARVFALFGCGGDRDRGKRPQMAAIAEKYADRVIVTSDNPRSEDPAAILNEIDQGFSDQGKAKRVLELDRRKAIQQAVSEMRAGDVLVIAGKGHETYQIIGSETKAFSDFAEAKSALG